PSGGHGRQGLQSTLSFLDGKSLEPHVVLKKGFDSLEEMDDVEADLLDRAWGLTAQSRLSCQVKVQDENLEVEIPKYTVNYISEGH
ncbi:hypothetical protein LNT78_27110, partial [Klebsiella pneumoniae]|nr:hypothetical protein [Klebsiella pneumoniae]